MKLFLPLLIVAALGAGCSEAAEPIAATSSSATTATASSTTAPAPPRSTDVPHGIGKKDPQALVKTIKETTGITMTPVEADSIATDTCGALDDGESLRAIADMFANTMSDVWGDQPARMVALATMLEYCPRYADVG